MSYNNYNWDYRRQRLVGPSQLLAASDLFHPTADQKYSLGCEYDLNDGTGRWFRYCKDSGTGISKARMSCGLPPDAESVNIAQTGYAHAVGDTKFDVLMTTANGITDHCLVDGYMLVNQGAAGTIGDFYIIKDNKWTTSDTVLNLQIADTGGIRTAIVVTDEISVIRNIFRDTKVDPTTHDAVPVGVPLVDVAAGYYYWAQFRGICPMIGDASDTLVVGDKVGRAATPGTAGAAGTLGADTDVVWGTAVMVAHTAQSTPDVILVNLMLP